VSTLPPVIDVCGFHDWSTRHEIGRYLDPAWREFLIDRTEMRQPLRSKSLYANPTGAKHPATYPEQGVPGSDPQLLVRQLLGQGRRDRLVLGYDEAILTTAFPPIYVARALVRAANDWTVDRWLTVDDRLYGLIMILNAMPEEAAAEIRRMGKNERMVGVAMGANAQGKPFGHPIYHPIYAAACEQGLPVVIQVGSDSAASLVTGPMAGGLAATFGEYAALSAQSLNVHVSSLIMQATFEVFPDLRIVLLGGGATWIPPFLWRLNYSSQINSRDVPWLKRRPHEYFRDHVKVSTYSLERVLDARALGKALGTLPWIEDSLLYAGGYPNYDWEEPAAIAGRLPAEWHEKVFRQNALGTFRWPDRAGRASREGLPAERLLDPGA
jgi:predicted TIM-barrel fold metal-dependent hydrolase